MSVCILDELNGPIITRDMKGQPAADKEKHTLPNHHQIKLRSNTLVA